MFDVSIILVNYHTNSLVYNLIDDILFKSSGFSYEIIVVDNSDDLSAFHELKDICTRKSKNIIVINAQGNIGFGKGNNLGAQYSNGKYLLFLNTDTILLNNAIFELFSFLKNNNTASIVGANLYTREKYPNHSFVNAIKNLKFEKRKNGILNSIICRFYRNPDFNYTDNVIKIKGYVCGACLMIRKDDFHKLGGFDKDIFMYAEEALLCYRVIKELNKNIYNIPTAKVIHFDGGSFDETSDFRAKCIVDGNYIYYLKIFGKKIACKYLKQSIKIYSRKSFISRIFFRKKHAGFIKMKQAYVKKLNDVMIEGKK